MAKVDDAELVRLGDSVREAAAAARADGYEVVGSAVQFDGEGHVISVRVEMRRAV